VGDWGWGLGAWGLAPIPTPQSPIPNPQSPIPNPQYIFVFLIDKTIYLNIFEIKILN